MNSESPAADLSGPVPRVGTTLQAVLQYTDGTMDSMAVPVPLPEVIIRVEVNPAARRTDDAAVGFFDEVIFRRARSADSVLRYIEDECAEQLSGGRRCAGCHEHRSVYFVPKLAAQEPLGAKTAAYCEECYGTAAS
jgi:hypothetical protein